MNEETTNKVVNFIKFFEESHKTEIEQLNTITEQLKEINNNLKDTNDDLLWILNFIRGGNFR